jgi:alkaline phosphatase D
MRVIAMLSLMVAAGFAVAAQPPAPAEPATATPSVPADPALVDVIAFGSCARERQEQPIWDRIIEASPDLFLFIGDNQYADVHPLPDGKTQMRPVTDIARLHQAYADLDAKPGFQKMRAHCPILATWDDHDFGANDAGNDYPLRKESQRLFQDFYRIPSDDPARARDGIYYARSYGQPGTRLQVIMLDTRFFRDTLERRPKDAPRTPGRPGPYIATADTSKTILGTDQWAWLEAQLREPADIRIIASSIQVISDEHGYETWGNFPHERRRLFDLIDATNAAGVFFISGDRHLTEISVERGRDGPVPYPMWDLTSSGMTEATKPVDDANAARVGPVLRTTNFGVISIAWGHSPDDTRITLSTRGDQGQLLTMQTLFLADLKETR